jgi:hypothetical protein
MSFEFVDIVMLGELVQFYSEISMLCVFEDEGLRQGQFNDDIITNKYFNKIQTQNIEIFILI